MSFFRKIKNHNEHLENIFRTEKITKILKSLGIYENEKNNFLKGLIGEDDNKFPLSLIGNDHFIRRSILDNLHGGHGVTITAEQEDQALQLIQSGDLFRDVGYGLSVIIKFTATPANYETPPPEDLIQNLPPAILKDIQTLLSESRIACENGAIPDPQLLNNTLRTIYQTPQIGNAVRAANLLFDNNHPSLRLALIIYARMNKVNIEEADIDEVRRTLLNMDSPDLGGLLIYIKDNKERLLIN